MMTVSAVGNDLKGLRKIGRECGFGACGVNDPGSAAVFCGQAGIALTAESVATKNAEFPARGVMSTGVAGGVTLCADA